jgi:integrase
MPRTPSIRYFDSRRAYYTQYQGKQHCLACGPKDEPDGPTYRAAVQKFSEIMHVAEVDRASDNNLVRTVLEQYARHLRNQGRTATLRVFRASVKSAADEFGDLKVKELKPFHVQAWLDKKGAAAAGGKGRAWHDTMKRTAFGKLRTAFRWAVKMGFISKNPLPAGTVEVPRARSRGRDFVLTTEEHCRALGKARPHLADLITFLEGTGCRPAEACHAEARHYDRAMGAIVYRHDAVRPDYVHKTARSTGKDRVILLTPELADLVERLCLKHPAGPLLRNRHGKPWKDQTVAKALQRLGDKVGLRGRLIAYCYRHTFATQFLLAGGSIKVLAELMGNSVAMIEKHYGHLDADRATLRNILIAFKGGRQGVAGSVPPAAQPAQAADRLGGKNS